MIFRHGNIPNKMAEIMEPDGPVGAGSRDKKKRQNPDGLCRDSI